MHKNYRRRTFQSVEKRVSVSYIGKIMKIALRLPSVFLLLLSFSLLLNSCQEALGGFEEYAGQNLIPADDLTSANWQLSIIDNDYLIYTSPAAFAGDTSALPWNTDISRLEVPNLAVNGDFEAGLANWSVNAPNTITRFDSLDGTHGALAIDDWSLYFSQLDRSELINFDLAAGLLDGFVDNGIYAIRFDFRGRYINQFDVNNGSGNGSYLQAPWQYDTGTDLSFPLLSFPDDVAGDGTIVDILGAASPFFSVGTQIVGAQLAQLGYLDNFKVVRTDVDKWIYLDVPLIAAGRSELVSGTYEFSVYVRDDPQLTPTVPNAFAAVGISLRLQDLTPYPQGEGWRFFAADGSWTDWNRISVIASINIEESVADTDNVLQLAICPTDIGDQIPGRLLIAAPTLSLVP